MIKRLPYRLLAFISTMILVGYLIGVVFAVDTSIDTDVSNFRVRPGVVWTDADTAYYFFSDETNDDFFYRKTTNGGTVWGSAVTVFTDDTDVVSGAVWYDQWTEGVTGSQIHIIGARNFSNDYRYRTLETATDTLGTAIDAASDSVGTGAVRYNTAITKARNGNLYMKFNDGGDQGFRRLLLGETTWAGRTDLATGGADIFQIFPDGNSSDTADIVLIRAREATEVVSLNEYDDSANSWTTTTIYTATDFGGSTGVTATIRASDQHILVAGTDQVTLWTDVTTRIFDTFGSGSITELTAIVINPDRGGQRPVIFVAPNDDIYVAYDHEGTGTFDSDVRGVYVVSTDGGTSWSSEIQFTDDDTSNMDYMTTPFGCPDGCLFAPIFVDLDTTPVTAFINVDNAVTISSSSSSSGSMVVTGTLGGSGGTPAEIVAGGETIILTLTDTAWVAAGATFDAQRQAIIDGLDSNLSDQNGWDARRADFAVTDVVRTSASVVTITLTASSAYAIPATETITATAPAAALTSSSNIIGTPTFAVTADFQASGNRVSTAIDLSSVTDVAYCALAWEATTPASTTITVDTSINGGTAYTLGHANGNCPAGITVGASLATITDFRIRVNYTTTDSSVTPTIRTLSLIIEDDSGQDLYYQLNTTPGVTITDRSANSNTGTMSYPVTGSAVSSIGILTSTRVGVTASTAVRSSDVASAVSGAAVAVNLFQQTEEGFASLPGQSLVTSIASIPGAPYPIRGVWLAVAGLVVIALGIFGMMLTRSLLVAAILMGLGLAAWAIVGTGLIPGWTIFLFVAMAGAFIMLRPKIPV